MVDGLNCLYNNLNDMIISNGSIEYTEGGFQTIEATFVLYNSV